MNLKKNNQLETTFDFMQKHEKIFAITITSIVFMVLHQITNATTYPYDAGLYWDLSSPSTFFNFPTNIRGYFYPFLLLPAHAIAEISGDLAPYAFRIYSSILYAFALTIVLPSFYVRVFGGKISLLRRLIVPLLVATLFRGVVIYPLSDLPSFILIVGCANLLLSIKISKKMSVRSTIYLVASGVLAYGAYNTRTIYLFPALFIFFLVPFVIYKGQLFKTKLVATLLLTLGVCLAGLPQATINLNNQGKFTPVVIAQVTDKSLFALQLMWGVTIQRYSTNIGPGAAPGQYFMERAGLRLFESEDLSNAEISVATYLSLVANNPMHFVGTYTRHVINGLDLRDGEVYMQDATIPHNTLAAINFSTLFLGLWILHIRRAQSLAQEERGQGIINQYTLFSKSRSSPISSWRLWLALLLLPVLAIIPGAIETRFFLAIHFLIYCTIAFNCSIDELKEHLNKNFVSILLVFIVLFSLFFAISLSTMATQQNSVNLMYKFAK